MLQKLPTGEQFFTNLRQKNMIYVDKTQLIHEMMNVGSFVFLSRPQIALDQIRTMHYAQPYLGRDKTVILLGIAFDKATRNIADWQHEVLAR